jgi:hypothetical protein
VDGLFSSQRITVIHDGARYARFQKVRELASWPTALAAWRVCPSNPGTELNCGVCEKCLRTRLELLAAGVEETASLGPSLTPIELWNNLGLVGDRAVTYEDLLAPLRARGLTTLCEVLEKNSGRIGKDTDIVAPTCLRMVNSGLAGFEDKSLLLPCLPSAASSILGRLR